MVILVKLLGIFIVGVGIAFFVKPKLYEQYAVFWTKGKRLYVGAILNILIGVILLLVASGRRLAGTILTLGILGLVKGIIILTLGQKKMKSMFKWWQGRSLFALRLVALVAIAFGVLLLYICIV